MTDTSRIRAAFFPVLVGVSCSLGQIAGGEALSGGSSEVLEVGEPAQQGQKSRSRRHRLFVMLGYRDAPVEVDHRSQTLVYHDDFDAFEIAVSAVSAPRARQAGITFGGAIVRRPRFESDLAGALHISVGSDVRGLDFGLASQSGVRLRDRWFLHGDVGLGYAWARTEAGELGTGGTTGADFAFGEDGAYLPTGSRVSLYCPYLSLRAGAGVRFDITPRLFIDARWFYAFYASSKQWYVLADRGGGEVELERDRFDDLTGLSSVENRGPGGAIGLGFRP